MDHSHVPAALPDAGSEHGTERPQQPSTNTQTNTPSVPDFPTVDGGAVPDNSGLSARERDILAFERRWWQYAGVKEQSIRELFGMSATRYYQILNTLIDRPEAVAFDPMLVKRLRRVRAERQRQRSARRLGIRL